MNKINMFLRPKVSPVFLIVFFLALCFGLAYFCTRYFSDKPGIAPEWVQAVGSIVAIVGVWWITDQDRKNESQERRKSIFAVAEAAYEQAIRIENALSEPDIESGPIQIYNVYNKVVIDGVVRALDIVPLHEVGSRQRVMSFLSLRNQFAFLGPQIEIFLAGPTKHPDLSKLIESCEQDPTKRREAWLGGQRVLIRNVKTHLDRIKSDYASLNQS